MKGLRNPVDSHVGKTYERRHQIKKFDKTDPQKWVILIQNTISKFLKTKNQIQKRPLKFQKINNM